MLVTAQSPSTITGIRERRIAFARLSCSSHLRRLQILLFMSFVSFMSFIASTSLCYHGNAV